jgi:hypothetical protein
MHEVNHSGADQAEFVPVTVAVGLEDFRNRYGGCGFEDDQLNQFWLFAQSRYASGNEKLPYHNFEHALDTLNESLRLAGLYDQHNEGKSINRKALVAAALLHDADYHEKLVNYSSKEARSAALLVEYGGDFGLDWNDVVTADHAIRATQAGIKPHTPEAKILIRADLRNVFSSFGAFSASTTKLYVEELGLAIRGGRPFDALGFRPNAVKILAEYFIHDLSLYPGEKKSLLRRPLQNIANLVADLADNDRLSMPDEVRKLGSAALTSLLGKIDHKIQS